MPASTPHPKYFVKAHDNSWIHCCVCGRRSFSREDAIHNYCGNCNIWHPAGITLDPPIPHAVVSDAGKLESQQKIIVALFLCLGKAMNALDRSGSWHEQISVSEDEIRQAWQSKTSPVRLISRNESIFDTVKTFEVVRGNLDLRKTGMKLDRPMPESKDEKDRPDPLKIPKRVFDLE